MTKKALKKGTESALGLTATSVSLGVGTQVAQHAGANTGGLVALGGALPSVGTLSRAKLTLDLLGETIKTQKKGRRK